MSQVWRLLEAPWRLLGGGGALSPPGGGKLWAVLQLWAVLGALCRCLRPRYHSRRRRPPPSTPGLTTVSCGTLGRGTPRPGPRHAQQRSNVGHLQAFRTCSGDAPASATIHGLCPGELAVAGGGRGQTRGSVPEIGAHGRVSCRAPRGSTNELRSDGAYSARAPQLWSCAPAARLAHNPGHSPVCAHGSSCGSAHLDILTTAAEVQEDCRNLGPNDVHAADSTEICTHSNSVESDIIRIPRNQTSESAEVST